MRAITEAFHPQTDKPSSSPFACFLYSLLIIAVSLLPRNASGQVSESMATSPVHASTMEVAVLAGGCFWGVDGVFKHVKGVIGVTSGYAGGAPDTAQYETVSTGTTGHAESVEITYDPAKITYSQLLKVFFFVAHVPTELDRQGPDQGTQYRSVIFYANDQQKHVAENYIKQLTQDKAFREPIVTEVVPLKGFYPAEGYHQNFLERNPENPYIVFNDLPKLVELHKQFPALYSAKPLAE
jgi:peptide-methionine (S)-S-oxide reductase